jgi:peptidoglycan/LPS O-acetylase OafA/YrhL
MPVFVVLQREATDWPIPLRAAVGLTITAVLATLSYRWIERPVLRRRGPTETAVHAVERGTSS